MASGTLLVIHHQTPNLFHMWIACQLRRATIILARIEVALFFIHLLKASNSTCFAIIPPNIFSTLFFLSWLPAESDICTRAFPKTLQVGCCV
jgi:hypothetical protein